MRAMAINPQRIPKIRQHAEITLSDGVTLNGYVFVEATARIQDLLNDPMPFMPFMDETDTVHILNKTAIVRVLPFD